MLKQEQEDLFREQRKLEEAVSVCHDFYLLFFFFLSEKDWSTPDVRKLVVVT